MADIVAGWGVVEPTQRPGRFRRFRWVLRAADMAMILSKIEEMIFLVGEVFPLDSTVKTLIKKSPEKTENNLACG